MIPISAAPAVSAMNGSAPSGGALPSGPNPPTVNPTAQTVAEIIHGILFDVGVTIIMRAAIAYQPWLGFPIIKQLFAALLNWLAKVSYKDLAQFATVQIIAAQTDAEKNAYAKAEGALRAAHLSGDPNALAQATADFKKTLAALIHYDGSFTP